MSSELCSMMLNYKVSNSVLLKCNTRTTIRYQYIWTVVIAVVAVVFVVTTTNQYH